MGIVVRGLTLEGPSEGGVRLGVPFRVKLEVDIIDDGANIDQRVELTCPAQGYRVSPSGVDMGSRGVLGRCVEIVELEITGPSEPAVIALFARAETEEVMTLSVTP